jgi:glycerol-3-phosphate acyltransferase PlsY
VALGTFAIVFAVSRFVSLASIAATASVPLWFLIANADDATTVGFMAIATILILRHQQNIRRLIEGREPKFVPKSAR